MIEVVDFPTFKIAEQIFYVPGAALDGGLTSGGARILTPEPGGIGVLEIRPALQVTEFDYPLSSWLMSKTNGEPLRVRLAPTPQIMRLNGETPWNNDQPWDSGAPWAGDNITYYTVAALKGTTQVTIDASTIDGRLYAGHVIGHGDQTYKVDRVQYNTDSTVAVVTIKPPLRNDVTIGDICLFRPYFTGVISNGRDIIQAYDAAMRGHIQMPKIVMTEARI